jgi:hypothetical protein
VVPAAPDAVQAMAISVCMGLLSRVQLMGSMLLLLLLRLPCLLADFTAAVVGTIIVSKSLHM